MRWPFILRRTHDRIVESLQEESDNNFIRARKAEQAAFQAKIDLDHAKAGIAMLKSQLPKDWEQRQKAGSDRIGDALIKDMKENPKKYLP